MEKKKKKKKKKKTATTLLVNWYMKLSVITAMFMPNSKVNIFEI